MPEAVYRVLSLLCTLVMALPVGTNLGLLHLLWMLVSGWLLAVTKQEAWISTGHNWLGGLTLMDSQLRQTGLAEVQMANPSTRAPITGAMYISGYGMWEYHRARTTVITAPVKYSTRQIPARTPMMGTSRPTSSPTAPADLAVASQGHHDWGTP